MHIPFKYVKQDKSPPCDVCGRYDVEIVDDGLCKECLLESYWLGQELECDSVDDDE